MKLVKHETSTLIVTFSRESTVAAFEEAISLYRNCKFVYETLVDFVVNNGDEFDLLDALEPYSSFDVSNLSKFRTFKCSKSGMVNKYLDRVFEELSAFKKNLDAAIDASFCISKEELDLLMKQAKQVTAGMIFFALVEFHMFDAVKDDDSVHAENLDEIIDTYCQKTRMDANTLISGIIEDSKIYKLRFDVFDSYPELEELFQKYMGPNILGVDESMLTIEMARQVVNGEITPEALVEMMASLAREAGEANS